TNAFMTASHYLSLAHELNQKLGETAELELLLQLAECQYLSNQFGPAENLFKHCFTSIASTSEQKARILGTRIPLLIHQGKIQEASESGFQAIKLLGFAFPKRPSLLRF